MPTYWFTKKVLVVSIFLFGTSLYTQAQFSPTDIGGLEIWFAGDSGITLTEGLVSQWNDLSPNGRHAISWAPSIQPSTIPGELNGHQVVSFDGIYNFLAFPEVSNCRTIFWVIRENPAADVSQPRPLLGYSGGINFLRGPDRKFWDNTYAHPGVFNGVTRLNFQEIDGTQTVVPQGYFLLSLQTTENVQATNLTMEAEIYGRTWWGEFAELIIYSSVLTPEEISTVESYLANKYGPPATAIPDVEIPYGFCDTLICAPDNFLHYNWSTGDETQCALITSPGEYTVAMTDYLGRLVQDTVIVSYPGNTQIPIENSICEGELFLWNTELNFDDYTFHWTSGSTASNFSTATSGEYQLTIQDTLGCSEVVAFHVEVDHLLSQTSLGPDLQLCAGNNIGLLSNPNENLDFLWSTDATTPTIPIFTSGEYSVTVTNANDCVVHDTIQIQILGVAPLISFDASGLCSGASSDFHAVASDAIANWNWNFGDSQSASGQNVIHTFADGGEYIVVLEVEAVTGCSSTFADTLSVQTKPIVAINHSPACNNTPVTFSDNSTAVDGNIVEWHWLIDGVFYDNSSVTTTITSGGFQNILLEVTDDHGCSAELNALVDILFAPEVDFDVLGVCEGTLTSFDENVITTQSGSITLFVWNFGDNTGSILPNPTHFYPESGDYEITLNASAANGCSNALHKTITIFKKPIADFSITNACLHNEYTFHDVSTSQLSDPITTWQWVIDGQTALSGEAPSFTFNELGLTPVSLLVSTENNCTAFISQQIPVWGHPQAEFSFSPEIGPAPFEVHFVNETVGIDNAHWIFGDTHESTELNPTHTYTLNSTYYARLIAVNHAGCTDTAAAYITVADPIYDVALQIVEITATDHGNVITAKLTNTGNITITQMILSWQVGNDAPVLEEWNGELFPETTLQYEFHSMMQDAGNQFGYICVVAEPSPLHFIEVNKTDNEICQPISNTGLEVFPPYPNPGDDRMFIRFITPIDGDLEVRIYDISGKLAMELNDVSVPKGFHQYFIDISNLQTGSYRLSLEMESLRGVVSFMKIHKE